MAKTITKQKCEGCDKKDYLTLIGDKFLCENHCSDCGDSFTEADTQTRKTGRCWQCACNDHSSDICWG